MPSNIVCPKCGEENPQEAVMCWSCFATLPGIDGAGERARAEREAEARRSDAKRLHIRRQEQREKAKDAARAALLVGALASWLASVYFPERRGALIGTGAACVVALASWLKWEKRAPIKSSLATEDADEDDPTRRILNTFLLYAVKDGASQVRLRAGIGVRVHYLIGDEWHEQMRLPAFIWEPLHALLLKTTNDWQSPIPFEKNEIPVEFWPQWKTDPEYPIQIVTLTLHEIKPPQRLSEPQTAS